MITYLIIAITALVSIIAFNNRDLFERLVFHPYSIKRNNQGYRFLSYGFLHADWAHLLINMFVLYSFGILVEDYYKYVFDVKGEFYYALLYLGALALSAIPSFGKQKDNYNYKAVGASGAVSAIVFSSIVFEPLNKLYLFFLPIPIPAILFGIIYLIYSVYMSKRNIDNIGHDVHFWGAIYGMAFTIALKPSLFTNMFETIAGTLR